MAVSATFAADFSSFQKAVEKAELKLTGLRSESGRVEKALTRMGDSFSGKKIFADAELATKAVEGLGGVSKLTAGEQSRLNGIVTQALDKYKALGQEAPKHLTDIAAATKPLNSGMSNLLGTVGKLGPLLGGLGLGLSIGSIVSFGKNVADFSGKMLDLEAQTRITTSRLQAFDFVGGDVGLTVEDITTSADQLAKRLGGDDKSVNAALEKLNLSAEDFKGLNVDEVMFRIDDALVGVGNSFDRAAVLSDLFGKSGAKLGRLMDGSLQEVIDKAEKTGPIIDRELLEKADKFGEYWEHGWKRFQAAAVTAIDAVLSAWDRFERVTNRVGRAVTPAGFGGTGENTFGAGNLSRNLGIGQPFIGPRKVFGPAMTIGEPVWGSGIGNLLKSNRELESSIKKADDSFQDLTFTVQSITTDMSGTGSMLGESLLGKFTVPKNPLFHGLFNAIDPRLSMFGPRDISGRAQGGAGFGMGPGALVGPQSLLGSLKSGFKDLLSGFTGGGGASGLFKNLGGSLIGGIGNALGGALTGGISSLLGLATKGLGKLFGGLFGAEGKKTNRARDSAISDFTGISGDKGASQAKFRELAAAAGVANSELDRLFSTKRTKDFESAMDSISQKIGAFTNDQEADQERLTKAIEKYGFTLEQLGPAFQKKSLDAQAKELIEDWRVLIGAGVEITDVNNGMAEAINSYLQTAMKLGQEVPNAFKPILQKMLEQGTLTDDAGNAITDLEKAGIHFSSTMTEGFDKVVKKLDELIDKIGLASVQLGAMPAVPTSIADQSGASVSDLIPVPMAAGGRGRVTRPTLFAAGISGPEDYAFSGENRSFGSGSDPALLDEMRAMRSQIAAFMRTLPIAMRDAVLLVR